MTLQCICAIWINKSIQAHIKECLQHSSARLVMPSRLLTGGKPSRRLTETKIRPALIISNDHLNEMSEDCIAVPLTTVIKDAPYSFLITQKDLASGELIASSRIRLDKVFSVKKSLIIKKIGLLKKTTFQEIIKEFFRNFS